MTKHPIVMMIALLTSASQICVVNAQEDDAKQPEPPIVAKSEDGTIDGIVLHFSPPSIDNADQFDEGTAAAALELHVRMGNAKPEWGVYRQVDGRLPQLIAIGYGSAGMKGPVRVFRYGKWEAGPVFGSEMFSIQPDAVYAPFKKRQKTKEGARLVTLRRCLPQKQKLIKQTPAKAPGSPALGLEIHHSPPTLESQDDLIAGVASVAIPLMVDGNVVMPEFGIFQSSPDGKRGDLLYRGRRDKASGRIIYTPLDASRPTYTSDGNGALVVLKAE